MLSGNFRTANEREFVDTADDGVEILGTQPMVVITPSRFASIGGSSISIDINYAQG